MNPNTIEKNYNSLLRLGIAPRKIMNQPHLLGRNIETIEKNYDNLIQLGIKPKQISTLIHLLGMNPDTIKKNYDNLLRLGIKPQRISTNAQLLGRNSEKISENFNYLVNVLKIDEKKINMANLLNQNPDAFAKKLRILKIEIFGLKRRDVFNPNYYQKYFLSSPATLMAKKSFLINNGIDSKSFYKISHPWTEILRKIDNTLSDEEVEKRSKILIFPLKHKYDLWMNEYKLRAEVFAKKKGRRLIIKV